MVKPTTKCVAHALEFIVFNRKVNSIFFYLGKIKHKNSSQV